MTRGRLLYKSDYHFIPVIVSVIDLLCALKLPQIFYVDVWNAF